MTRSPLVAVPIILAALVASVWTGSSARAGVDDFTFESMAVEYTLAASAAGESALTTREDLVAVFPETDQNHGIQRAIPLSYNRLATHPTITAVTDGSGQTLPYTEEESDGYLLVTIKDDNFVHGRVEYIITYTQTNVIQVPDNAGGNQEFYWDVNGTGWAQPFGVVSATVTVPPDLAKRLTSESACYQGDEGSSTACGTSQAETTSDGRRVFTFGASDLGPYQTLSFAIGFSADTFVLPDTSLWAHPLGALFAVSAGLLALLLLLSVVMRLAVWRNARGRGIIIAQYEAPEGMTPLMASNIVRRSSRAVVASILRLAVQGNLIIRDEKVGNTRRSSYQVDIVTLEGTSDEDRMMLEAVYGEWMATGASMNTSTPDTARARRLRQAIRVTKRNAVALGFRTQPHRSLRRVATILTIIAGVAVFFMGGVIVTDGYGGTLEALITYLGCIPAVLVTLLLLNNVAPLTQAGAQAREHLQGLKLFIRLAEADRIAFLQSPSGAERRVDASKPGAIINLYEKALPYAVLFGLENQWARSLATLYEQDSRTPSWYVSNDPFLDAAFITAVATFATTSTTWASSASSSSSSGASGGGFAGGGGGGGGGGGV